jgi:hypothetical protein
MKTIGSIICILIIGGLIVAFSYKSPTTTEIIVWDDVTDEYLSHPDPNEILSLGDFTGDNKWNGALIRYSTLSDISYNTITEIKLPAENKWLSNEIERDRAIKTFKEKLAKTISSNDSIGKNHSFLYVPIARELNRLSKSKSQKRIVVIYSDLMENDPDFSFYDKHVFSSIESNSDSVKGHFESQEPLSALFGIEIYIVYRSSDVAKDMEFRIVSELFKKMFQGKGATVYISANLAN